MRPKVSTLMPTLKQRLSELARDKEGNIVLGEPANPPLIVATTSTALSFTIFLLQPLGIAFLIIAFGSWFTWAWLEIFDPTTPLRRIMGSVFMAALIIAGYLALQWFHA